MIQINPDDLTPGLKTRLAKIKVFLSDVDGILTDGKLRYDGEEMGFNRSFHTWDGYGIKILRKAGLKFGIVSGGDSRGVRKRFEELGVDYLFLGSIDKRSAYEQVVSDGFKDEEILYIGDEFFDLPLIKRAGVGVTVPGASYEVRQKADYITQRGAGEGCVREVIDLLRFSQSIVPPIADF